MKTDDPDKLTKDLWHNDPNNWIWGIIYYNPKDKRILPPKRIEGLGWTINFANPLSILAFILIVVGIVWLIVILPKH